MYKRFGWLVVFLLLGVVAGCSEKPAVLWVQDSPYCPYCRTPVPMKSTACPRCAHDFRWEPTTCHTCKGTGKLTCGKCNGTGTRKNVPCENCVDGFITKVEESGQWKLRVPGFHTPEHYGEQIGELADAEYTENQRSFQRANYPMSTPYTMPPTEHAYRCPVCKGKGTVDETCTTCKAAGKVTCNECRGVGRLGT
jgi:hypothetical protein